MTLHGPTTNVVLLFHSVCSRDWFRTTIKTIKRAFQFVSQSDLEAYFQGDRAFNRACHVTFDDGDSAFMDIAFPVLQDMGIASSLFVSPQIIRNQTRYWFQELEDLQQHVGERQIKNEVARVLGCDVERIVAFDLFDVFKCMSIRQVQEVLGAVSATTRPEARRRYNLTVSDLLTLRDSGLVSIGAHSNDHPILALESEESSKTQIRDSIQNLSGLLGHPVTSFAYPNGLSGLDFGSREKTSLQECDVKLAFTANAGFFHRRTDPLAIPRVAFEGAAREVPFWIAGKLLFAPLWDRTRELLRSDTEAKARAEINLLLSQHTGG